MPHHSARAMRIRWHHVTKWFSHCLAQGCPGWRTARPICRLFILKRSFSLAGNEHHGVRPLLDRRQVVRDFQGIDEATIVISAEYSGHMYGAQAVVTDDDLVGRVAVEFGDGRR